MRRLFPILAGVAGLLLVASLVAGMVGWPAGWLAWAAIAATLAVHASTFAYLVATGRRVEAAAGGLGLPDWLGAQVEKNRRKALVYEVGGPVLVGLAAWSGDDRWWGLVVSAASLAFQVGAFVAESLIIVAQTRLMRDVAAWVKASDL